MRGAAKFISYSDLGCATVTYRYQYIGVDNYISEVLQTDCTVREVAYGNKNPITETIVGKFCGTGDVREAAENDAKGKIKSLERRIMAEGCEI